MLDSLHDEKEIPRSSVADVYKSIQNDLIYASDNLAATAAQKEELQGRCSFSFIGKAYLYDVRPKQLL
jgi:hypothetical protein